MPSTYGRMDGWKDGVEDTNSARRDAECGENNKINGYCHQQQQQTTPRSNKNKTLQPGWAHLGDTLLHSIRIHHVEVARRDGAVVDKTSSTRANWGPDWRQVNWIVVVGGQWSARGYSLFALTGRTAAGCVHRPDRPSFRCSQSAASCCVSLPIRDALFGSLVVAKECTLQQSGLFTTTGSPPPHSPSRARQTDIRTAAHVCGKTHRSVQSIKPEKKKEPKCSLGFHQCSMCADAARGWPGRSGVSNSVTMIQRQKGNRHDGCTALAVSMSLIQTFQFPPVGSQLVSRMHALQLEGVFAVRNHNANVSAPLHSANCMIAFRANVSHTTVANHIPAMRAS